MTLMHDSATRPNAAAQRSPRSPARIGSQLDGGPRRRLNAAAAGRSGRSDISERIEEIIAAEVNRSR
jgi:hypothetical protein